MQVLSALVETCEEFQILQEFLVYYATLKCS